LTGLRPTDTPGPSVLAKDVMSNKSPFLSSSIVAGLLAIGCADGTSSRPGPVIHFVTDTEVTRVFLPEQVHVRLTGFPPESLVTLRASMPGYASHASFVADAYGSVDVAAQAPEDGTYQDADADGLFWSMDPTGAVPGGPGGDLDVTVHAEVGGEVVATASLARHATDPGAIETEVHDDGLVAVLVTPEAPGPHPALLAFGGSEGGIESGRRAARHYASLGYSCLGLAYFRAPGLPPRLEDVPLEYFAKALSWMKQRPEVNVDAIGVVGASRGGELALILGARFPEVKAVLAHVPSGVVWPGETVGGAWTLGGQELPYVPDADAAPVFTEDAEGHRVEHGTPEYTAMLDAASPAALDAATTRVENVHGPVLMLASADDQMWPSCRLARIAMDRLTETGHAAAFADDLVCYPAAGHIVPNPGLPTTDLSVITRPDHTSFALGGTPAGTARAARDGFERRRAFLAKALR
jgi:dienelactone hydrolase